MGPSQMHALGLSQVDLIEPVLNLKAANATGITILGAVYLYIYGRDKSGCKWGTHQLVYIAKDINQLLLSREACEKLSMISNNFPAVGCNQATNINEVATLGQSEQSAEHTTDLSGMVLPEADHCTRQTLPMMRGDPLPIILKPGAKPVAVHTLYLCPYIGRTR